MSTGSEGDVHSAKLRRSARVTPGSRGAEDSSVGGERILTRGTHLGLLNEAPCPRGAVASHPTCDGARAGERSRHEPLTTERRTLTLPRAVASPSTLAPSGRARGLARRRARLDRLPRARRTRRTCGRGGRRGRRRHEGRDRLIARRTRACGGCSSGACAVASVAASLQPCRIHRCHNRANALEKSLASVARKVLPRMRSAPLATPPAAYLEHI